MLTITIPGIELFNEATNEFSTTKEYVLTLEHSLVSLSKWESAWNKAFLSKTKKTNDESIDYIRCMTLTQNVPASAYLAITDEIMDQIGLYIEAPMTATTFSKMQQKQINREIVTAEIIYYWMITLNIPFECQKWHLNRLLTLISVCNLKNQPPKKMSKKDLLRRNNSLNQMRRQQLNTKG
jgi:hypothetical protein